MSGTVVGVRLSPWPGRTCGLGSGTDRWADVYTKVTSFYLKKVFTEAEGLATCQEEARRVCEHRSAGVRAHGSKAERTGQKLVQSGVCSAFPGADWEPWKNSKQIVKTSETLLWH